MTNKSLVIPAFGAALFVLICGLAGRGVCETSIVIDGDVQFQFAETYFEKGEYFRAIGEYERFIFLFPQDPRVELATYKIGLSYIKGDRCPHAIETFHGLIDRYGDSELGVASYFRVGECYVKLGEFSKALLTLDDLLERTASPDIRDEVYYRSGWIFVEMEQWEKAQAAFGRISPANRDKYRLETLSEAMSERETLKLKNPTTAGILAVLPGAGHLYCERYQDAFIAFLLNGGMILAAYEAFDNGNEALGGLLTFFELGLYSGNIYSAVNSAHKHNRRQRRGFVEFLKTHSTLEAAAGKAGRGNGVLLSYQLRF